MKMSDVFELPLTASAWDVEDNDGAIIISCNTSKEDAAVAHAINCHDGLAESLDWLLHNAKKVLAGQSTFDMDECINLAETQLRKALEDAPR